jgi:large subunit ribosomal protein L4
MIKVQNFSAKGTKLEDYKLPKEFEVKENPALLAQAIYVYEGRAHVGLRKTKTRAEVNRTSKKLYRQKGTGGARHGSRRANIFVGGGVALGPRPEKRILTLPDKLKNQAKLLAYSLKAVEKQLILVSGISAISKTKEASNLIKVLEKATGAKRFTFILSDGSRKVLRFLRNLPLATTVFYKDANAYDIYRGGMIVLDKDVFERSTKDEKSEKKVKVKKEK